MKNKVCCFFINSVESSFVFTEIEMLSKFFKKVYIFYVNGKGIEEINRNFSNVELIRFNSGKGRYSFRSIIEVFSILIEDLLSAGTSWAYLKKIRYNISLLHISKNRSEEILNFIKEENIESDALFYSYWFDETTTVLAFLKAKGYIKYFICRAHGRDLYEYREPETGKLFHRKFQLKHLDRIFIVSKAGWEYLCKRYQSDKCKFRLNYLGTKDKGINPQERALELTIVSCSDVRDIKRIYLIPEILIALNEKVKWIHIGDINDNSTCPTEILFQKNIKNLSKFGHISVKLLGKMSNEEVLRFYANNHIDVFLSVSETEGLPVTMMEASSFGIPVVSTDVGGCKEVVIRESLLMPKEFNASQAADIIKFAVMNRDLRRESRKKWEESFKLEENFNEFIKEIDLIYR